MLWFILVRVLFVLAVTYAAILTRPFNPGMALNALPGVGLGILIIWLETRLRSAEVTDLLGEDMSVRSALANANEKKACRQLDVPAGSPTHGALSGTAWKKVPLSPAGMRPRRRTSRSM